jgi:ribonucleoside-diphosphate reductase alpha chain
MMGTLLCSHPDIESFIAAKADSVRLRNFNLSVLVTDAFIEAVKAHAKWELSFEGTVYKVVEARSLWEQMMRATYEYAEPGIIFIDRVNRANTLEYCETICATNPCGEVPLPAYGACVLGSINLARLIKRPFDGGYLDEQRLVELVRIAIRFLDDVIDVSDYPLPAQREEAKAKRRIGLGVTGLADALIQCGLIYGSESAIASTMRWMSLIERTAFLASAELAAEKGCFPLYDGKAVLASAAVGRLDGEARGAISRLGLRNGTVTAIAPAGTISLFAGNVSSGIEPLFDITHRRRILEGNGATREEVVDDYAYQVLRQVHGPVADVPETFVTARMLPPAAHLAMQAAVQAHVDNSVSKTINCRADLPFCDFEDVYLGAYNQGLKGCTTFRPNSVTGEVLLAGTDNGKPPAEVDRPRACVIAAGCG